MKIKPNESPYRFVHPTEFDYRPLCSIGNPNWEKPEHYEVSSEHQPHFFSYLAWEALRRNLIFQKFCDDYISSGLHDWGTPPKMLDQWGIAEFKHYKEDFISDNCLCPSWLLPKPAQVISNLYKELPPRDRLPNSNNKTQFADRGRSVSIDQGQVAIVFDLEQMVPLHSLLALQFKAAQTELETLLEQLRADHDVVTPKVGDQQKTLIRSLRLADALLSDRKLSRVELAKKIFPEIIEGASTASHDGSELDEIKIQNAMHKHFVRARNLIYGNGYLALVAKHAASHSNQTSQKSKRGKSETDIQFSTDESRHK